MLNPSIRFFQSKLREHLGNFRAIESSIKGALAELNVCHDMLTCHFRSFTFPIQNGTEERTAGRPSFELGYTQTARRAARLVGHPSGSLHDATPNPLARRQHPTCVRLWSNKSE